MEIAIWYLAVGAILWCLILSCIVTAQAVTINTLKGRSMVDEDLWRKQLKLNDYYEKDLTRCENKLGL